MSKTHIFLLNSGIQGKIILDVANLIMRDNILDVAGIDMGVVLHTESEPGLMGEVNERVVAVTANPMKPVIRFRDSQGFVAYFFKSLNELHLNTQCVDLAILEEEDGSIIHARLMETVRFAVQREGLFDVEVEVTGRVKAVKHVEELRAEWLKAIQ